MRLLTHNYLKSNVKGTENGYPLLIDPASVTVEDSPVDLDMLRNLIPKLDYTTVFQGAKQLVDHVDGVDMNIPEQLPDEPSDELLNHLYKVLFDVHVIEGFLVCPDTGRKFPIKEGVPNMILHEDEL